MEMCNLPALCVQVLVAILLFTEEEEGIKEIE